MSHTHKLFVAFGMALCSLGLFAGWESADWMSVSDVSFDTYSSGDALDATRGASHGHWESSVDVSSLGAAAESSERKSLYMHLEATTNLTFVSERSGRPGGGNVLFLSVQTLPRTTVPALPAGSKAGFAVGKNGGGDVSFLGWTGAGWRELASTDVAPVNGEAWYDVALRFRVSEDGKVLVQYLVKGSAGYAVLNDGGATWLDTGLADGDASISAVDFAGVGGLEQLSSNEKNGFTLRLR